MRALTRLKIDKFLLEKAKEILGLSTKWATLNEALKTFIQSRLKKQFLELQGKIDYCNSYDYKALRRHKNS